MSEENQPLPSVADAAAEAVRAFIKENACGTPGRALIVEIMAPMRHETPNAVDDEGYPVVVGVSYHVYDEPEEDEEEADS